MRIRIIELFNMINEKKEIPQKIKYENNIYVYSANDNRYHQITKNYPNVDTKDLSEVIGIRNFNYLHECAEIIEEPKKIEKIEKPTQDKYLHETGKELYENDMKVYDKLNELIDEINNLKENE